MAVTDSAAAGLASSGHGATHILLRMPAADTRNQYQELTRLVGASSLPVLVRGRPDLALAAGAAGVNLPAADISVEGARALLGLDRLLGRSVHSLAAATTAAAAGADFVLLGPIYQTRSHPDAPGLGLAALAEVVRALEIPVLAIGGVDRERARECLAVGAGGYAAIRLFKGEASR